MQNQGFPTNGGPVFPFPPGGTAESGEEADAARRRADMVAAQIAARGVRDPRVLDALQRVPRQWFVPDSLRGQAYEDRPLPIGHGQTISQPYMVGCMTECLAPGPADRILEIGTGSGYQTAVLALLAGEVHTVERISGLFEKTRTLLSKMGIKNVICHLGDGSNGLPECAPFAGVMVTAGCPRVPAPLAEQLAEGGRLVAPVGTAEEQQLLRGDKRGGRLRITQVFSCQFVPLIGAHAWPEASPEEG